MLNEKEEAVTDFGFQSVPLSEKQQRVQNLFSQVAPRYDLMNNLMSLGLHQSWKRRFVEQLPLGNGLHILDAASGTGDIGRLIVRRALALEFCDIGITLCDLTEGMLREGRQKWIRSAEPTLRAFSASWVCGTAEGLPLPSNAIDLYTISFGLRNVADREGALAEAYRVLKPGGSFFCLEFSFPTNPFFKLFYDCYSFHCIPRMGAWVAGNRGAYQYLVESIRKFPSQKILAHMMEDAGFQEVSFHNMSEGIVAIHQGRKPGGKGH